MAVHINHHEYTKYVSNVQMMPPIRNVQSRTSKHMVICSEIGEYDKHL